VRGDPQAGQRRCRRVPARFLETAAAVTNARRAHDHRHGISGVR
jgi:hypothetical protein